MTKYDIVNTILEQYIRKWDVALQMKVIHNNRL